MSSFELHHGDCLEVMRTLPDALVDCVLTDPPYGTTACKWDAVIPFEPMWEQLKRIAKPKAAICLFGSQPFTSALVMSNPEMFKHDWVWEKDKAANFPNANRQPLKLKEDVLVFAEGQPNYNPQKELCKPYRHINRKANTGASFRGHVGEWDTEAYTEYLESFPKNIIRFTKEGGGVGSVHPTQKPVELLRYLLRTYTNEAEIVLDFTMGSGSTGVACELEGRKFIGIEKDDEYFRIAKERIEGVRKREPLFMEQAA